MSGAGKDGMLAWGELKPTTVMGQMPVLRFRDGRHELVQSKAIARFLSRTSATPEGVALYPIDDAYLAAQVDMYMDSLDEVRAKVVPSFAIADPTEREAFRAKLFEPEGAIFQGFSKVDAQLSGSDFLLGGKLTLADLTAFVVVNQFRSGMLDGVPKEGWLDKLPKLKTLVEKVAAVPALKAYYTQKAASNQMFAAFV